MGKSSKQIDDFTLDDLKAAIKSLNPEKQQQSATVIIGLISSLKVVSQNDLKYIIST